MRVYCLFFLIALCGAADDTTTTTVTDTANSVASSAASAVSSAAAAISNTTIGSILGRINSTADKFLTAKHNIVSNGTGLSNFTIQSIISLGSQAVGNVSELAQKGVDTARNVGLQALNIGKQVTEKAMDTVKSLPGGKYMPTSMISNATNFGLGIGEKAINSSMSAVIKGMQVGTNVAQSVHNITGKAAASVHNGVVKVHQKATDLTMGAINGTVSQISNRLKGVGKWFASKGNKLAESATISG